MRKTLITILITMLTLLVTGDNTGLTKENPNQNQSQINYLNLAWWEKYQDPNLNQYISELYEKNHDLKIAALKVKEGEKIVRISFANELPQISFDGNLGRTMPSSDQQFGNLIIPSFSQYQFQLPLTASYEIDIWGENRLKTKSAQKQLEVIQQQERASYIAMTSAFAANYFNLVKTDKLIDLQTQIVKTQELIVSKTQKKYENGLCPINSLIAEQKILTTQKETLNNLKGTQFVLNSQLKVFLSDSDKIIKRTDCEKLPLMNDIPKDISSTVVEHRPDFMEAESYLKKSGYDVKIAKKEFLPKFIIYGQMGFNAYQWGRIFNNSAMLANAGIMPSFDVFTGGRKMAVLKLRKFEYEEALHNYQKSILTGIQEVNDSAATAKRMKKNYYQSYERLQLENKDFELITRKKEIGATSELEVLHNKEAQLMTKADEVSNKINFLISTISLYKAVGGQDFYNLNSPNNNVQTPNI